MNFTSKLPDVGTNIFTIMSGLANEHNALNLSQGFPNFDVAEELKERVNFHMQNGKNQYAPMAGVPILRERIAGKMERMYGQKVNPDSEITITASATQAIFTIISAFIKKGDEVILIEPAYDSYAPSIEICGATPVPYSLSAPDYKIDWEIFESLITAKTRMIIINTPHNPIGKTLKKWDLATLQRLTSGTDIMVLSDEVYEHLIFDGAEHQSVLRFPELYQRSMAVYSFGKTFHATGWRIGYVVGPDYLMKEFRKIHQFNVFSVTTFAQYGIADYLENPDSYLSLPNFFQKKRDFFAAQMQGSRLRPLASEGTYFQLFDYSEISQEPDTEFAKRMTTEFGVASIPVSVFYTNRKDEKVIRLCFAKTEELLEKAAVLLRKI